MLDTHLIYVALTLFSILAGAAIAISAAIVAVAAMRHHRAGPHRTLAAGRPTRREPALR